MSALAFVPDLPVLAAFVFACVAITLTPGPDMAFFLGKAVTQSSAAGFAAFAGCTTGLLVHTLLVAAGLAALLAASATAFLVLKIVGAAYLLWLAFQSVWQGNALSRPVAGAAPERLTRIYGKALTVNLLNPKIIVFFATFLPQFVTVGDPAASGTFVFLGLTMIVVSTPITVAMILAAGRVSARLRGSRRLARAIDWLFAAVMGGFAARLLLSRAA
jgi:threonine/homoserine/homoserine lactone efflux protein